MNESACDCVLCKAIGLQNESFIAHWEPFPVGIGHMKIIPRRHDAEVYALTDTEKRDFFELFERVKHYLDTSLGKNKPDGYNVGINIGEAAGQTIKHLHIHIIPRYTGDVPNPRGGVRNIKPPKVSW